MKTFLQLLLVSLLLTATSPLVHAQQLSDANELYDTYRFEEASKIYLRIVQKNQRGKEQATERLADCYRILGNKAEAEKWYALAVDYPDATNRINFNYGLVLRDLGKYAAAKEQFAKYAAQAPGDLRGNLYTSYMDQLLAWSKEEEERGEGQPDKPVAVNAAELNTEFVDVGATSLGDKSVVMASARPTDPKKKKRVAEKLKMWESAVSLEQGKLPTFAEPKLLLPVTRANANLIQGPASFTADGKTMFYTQSYLTDDGYGGQVEGLEIMYCTFNGKEWGKPEAFPYNSHEFNNAHPTISGDGKMLIYSSDMSGGYGATDVYMSRLNGTRWDKPRNLGANINTAEIEKYPILVDDSVLYFSSNGHITLGGQDIMRSVYRNGAWTKAENMRAPINSLDDDVCFVPLRDRQLALFSSARADGKGDLDIYLLCPASFVEAKGKAAGDSLAAPRPEAPAATPVAEAKQPESKKEEPAPQPEPKKEEPKKAEPAPQAEVKKEEPKKEEVKEVKPAEPKKEEVEATPVAAPAPAPVVAAPKKAEPAPQAEVKKEEPKKEEVKPAEPAPAPQPEAKREEPKPAPVAQQPQSKPEQAPSAASKKQRQFRNIAYAKNSLYPAKASYANIGNLIVFMEAHPNAVVELDVHSDAQGGESVNKQVSDQRAKILSSYLQQNRIGENRIVLRSHGSSRPLNRCSAGVECTEEEHAINRRVEVVVRY